MKYLGLLFVFALYGCDLESCEDRGGNMVFSHMALMPVKVGSQTFMQNIPQYKCVIENDNSKQ